MADNAPQNCCICLEGFTPPLDRLDLLRPDTCPTHLCHRDCIMTWMEKNRKCPLCRDKECTALVDQEGRSVPLPPSAEDNSTEMVVVEDLSAVLQHAAETDYNRYFQSSWMDLGDGEEKQ